MTKKTILMLIVAVALGAALGVATSYVVITGRPDSRYLEHPERLGDVVAALLVMGTYEYDGLLPDRSEERREFNWEQAIGSNPRSVTNKKWSELFRQHPEFFRIDDNGKAYLVWRRARERVWDTESRKELTMSELDGLSEQQKDNRLSRTPLEPAETTKLIEIAVNMHSQAIARRQELRWWVPLLMGVVGVLIGVLFKSGK